MCCPAFKESLKDSIRHGTVMICGPVLKIKHEARLGIFLECWELPVLSPWTFFRIAALHVGQGLHYFLYLNCVQGKLRRSIECFLSLCTPLCNFNPRLRIYASVNKAILCSQFLALRNRDINIDAYD